MAAAERTSGRAARLSTFAMIVRRSLTRDGGRLKTALAAIVVGAATVCALTSLHFDISVKMSQELRAFGANVIVSPGQAQDGSAQREEAALLKEAVAAMAGDALIGGTPYLHGLVRLDLGNAVMVGAEFAGLRAISPYWQVEGNWVTADFDERNAMIGRRLAESMSLRVGSTVTVAPAAPGADTAPARVTVRGIVDTGENEDNQIFVNLALAQRLLGLPGQADFALVSIAAQGPEADRLTGLVNERFAGLEARPIRKISEADGQILDRIEGLMALVVAIILIITTLGVNATLTAMIAERTPQIGLQKALGAENRAIVAQILAETAVIWLIAVTLGLGLGFALAQLLGQAVFGDWVAFRPLVLPLTAGLSLAAALAAALLPVRGIAGIVPARVLKGE